MDQSEKESIRAASEEISRELKTLVDSQDLDAVKQSQHLMYVYKHTHLFSVRTMHVYYTFF